MAHNFVVHSWRSGWMHSPSWAERYWHSGGARLLTGTLSGALATAVLSCAFTSAAFAQVVPPTLDACSTEPNSTNRLACFDREIARLHQLQHNPRAEGPTTPAGSTRGAATDQPHASSPAPSVGTPSSPSDRAGTATSSQTPPATAGAASPPNRDNPAAAADRFGLTPEMQHQREEQGKAPAPLHQITARVVSVHYLPRGELVVALDNGQTWQQAEYDGDVDMSVGEPVTIKAGALTAFYMKPRTGRIVRVKRIR